MTSRTIMDRTGSVERQDEAHEQRKLRDARRPRAAKKGRPGPHLAVRAWDVPWHFEEIGVGVVRCPLTVSDKGWPDPPPLKIRLTGRAA